MIYTARTNGQAHDQGRQLAGDKVVLENPNIGALLEARGPSAFQDTGQNAVGKKAGSTPICFEPSQIPYVWDVGSKLFFDPTEILAHRLLNVG